MFRVTAKTTTVTIGNRVFHPAVATCFQDELPPEVAERSDLLTIEEVPDAESTVEAGGLAATGTLQAGLEGGPDGETDAGAGSPSSAQDGAGEDDADPTVLKDETLTNGVAVITVGEGDDDGPRAESEPDPFADPAPPPAAPGSAETKPSGGRGRGSRK